MTRIIVHAVHAEGRPGFRVGPEATYPGGREATYPGGGEATYPGGGDDCDELVDAAWLYAWSHEALRPVAASVAASVIAAG
jgi:hypothetical protein